MATKQISLSELKQKVEDGWKKNQLAEYYGLPMVQMTKLLQKAGLKIRKFHAPAFELIDDRDCVTLQNQSSDNQKVETEDLKYDFSPLTEVLPAEDAFLNIFEGENKEEKSVIDEDENLSALLNTL